MSWIKVKTNHALYEYNDLRDSEYVAWIKLMALTSHLEHIPTQKQMLHHVHYKTLDSLQEKLNDHSIDLQYVLNKVLIDVQEVLNQREYWKKKQQEKRERERSVNMDVNEMSRHRLDKIRLDKISKEKGARATPPPKMKFLDAVFLTASEHQKLTEAIGQKNLEIGIEKLDYSITVKGGKYKDHYKTILNWNKRGFLKGVGARPSFQSGERDVRDYVPEERPEITEEQRQENIKRIKGLSSMVARGSP